MVGQRRNSNKNFSKGRKRGRRLTPEQEEKKREADRLERIRKSNIEEWKKLRKDKNICVIPGHEGWMVDRISRNPTEFANKVTGSSIPIEHYFFYPTRNRLPPDTQAEMYPRMKERLRILNKQGDFMYFYKKYPELVRNPPSNVIYVHNPTEEIDKFCDRDGWFKPENATRRGRRRLKFSIERHRRRNSNNFNNSKEGQETDWDLIDEKNNERNEKGMLYSNPY
tara:strand:+ start:6366 stop:7037 length:672 start_codon:yes stop_codon:yes gene_type:complete